MTKEEIRKFVKENASSGMTESNGEQIPFVAVPNLPDGTKLSAKEIVEALRANAKEEK